MNTFDHDDLMREIEKISASPPPKKILAWEQIPSLSALPEGRVEWIVEGLIPAGAVTLMAGESGTYKTFLAHCLARGVAEGSAFLGRKCVARKVLYLDRENPPALVRERAALLHLPASDDLKIWGAWLDDPPPLLGDPRLLEYAAEHKPLIVFDSFIRFHEMDENSANAMALVMGAARALANAGASVVILHHKPKGDGSHYRGSSDIRAGVDVAYAVSQDADAGLINFKCFKNRLAPEFALTLRPEIESNGDFAVVETPAASERNGELAKLQKLIEAQPGLTQSELVEQSGLARDRTIRLLKANEGKLWHTERGNGRALKYYPLGREPGDDSMGLPFEEATDSVN
ncbi:MAG: AAA family ATPase [Acidobacteria bacterium]|nr:AAA family ATPase [Acidobacteriota bacterium]